MIKMEGYILTNSLDGLICLGQTRKKQILILFLKIKMGFGLFSYSFTISVPLMSLCPVPHCTEQKKPNVPDLSAVNSTVVVCPGFSFELIPKSGRENPCVTSMLLIFNFILSPLFTTIGLGSNPHCLAVIEISFTFPVFPSSFTIASSMPSNPGAGTLLETSGLVFDLSVCEHPTKKINAIKPK